jgi:predicted anti-sigma-YlaC factor YlaD
MIEGSEEKAREHFARYVEITDGTNPSPYVGLATTLCIQRQYTDEFIYLLDQALSLDPEIDRENRFAAAIAQKKAQWYLEHIEDFFLIDMEGSYE